MSKKEIKMTFVCSKCGADNQEDLIDKEKSNENWRVGKEKCPHCGSKVNIKFN